MQGSFGVSVLELIAYLVPGGIALNVLLWRFPNAASFHSANLSEQLFLVAVAYVLGHIVAAGSEPLVKIRQMLQRITRRPQRGERYAFYDELRQLLSARFASQLTRNAEFGLCLRILEHSAQSSIVAVERLRALTLFARNMCVCFFGVAIVAAMSHSITTSVVCLFGVLALFARYVRFEEATSTLVFESAYVALSLPKTTMA
jgi:hypothetical protein